MSRLIRDVAMPYVREAEQGDLDPDRADDAVFILEGESLTWRRFGAGAAACLCVVIGGVVLQNAVELIVDERRSSSDVPGLLLFVVLWWGAGAALGRWVLHAGQRVVRAYLAWSPLQVARSRITLAGPPQLALLPTFRLPLTIAAMALAAVFWMMVVLIPLAAIFESATPSSRDLIVTGTVGLSLCVAASTTAWALLRGHLAMRPPSLMGDLWSRVTTRKTDAPDRRSKPETAGDFVWPTRLLIRPQARPFIGDPASLAREHPELVVDATEVLGAEVSARRRLVAGAAALVAAVSGGLIVARAWDAERYAPAGSVLDPTAGVGPWVIGIAVLATASVAGWFVIVAGRRVIDASVAWTRVDPSKPIAERDRSARRPVRLVCTILCLIVAGSGWIMLYGLVAPSDPADLRGEVAALIPATAIASVSFTIALCCLVGGELRLSQAHWQDAARARRESRRNASDDDA